MKKKQREQREILGKFTDNFSKEKTSKASIKIPSHPRCSSPLFSALLHHCILSLSNSTVELSLSTVGGHSTTQHLPHHHRRLPLDTSISSPLSGEATTQVTVAATPARHLPKLTPATTDHLGQRHHDRNHHLDILYPKVLAGTRFFTFENPHYSSSSPLSPACSGTYPTVHAGWAC